MARRGPEPRAREGVVKAIAYFEIPMNLDDGELDRIIETARETGFPMLAVEFDVEPDFADAPADGMSMEAVAGLRLGEAIEELSHTLDTVSPMRIGKLHARVVERSVANPREEVSS